MPERHWSAMCNSMRTIPIATPQTLAGGTDGSGGADASWLLMRVPGPGGLILDNPISALSRWKILDNLRRSLVTPAQILLLFLAWLMLLQPRFWTIVVAEAVLALPVLSCIRAILNKSAELPLDKHLHYTGRAIVRYLAQAGLSLTFLPYEAYFSLDAVVRTGGRMLFTHKRCWNGTLRAAPGAVGRVIWWDSISRCG